MILKKCIAYDNPCYTESPKMCGKPYGIVVHSTGCDNPYIMRYVQPSATDPNHTTILQDIGKNIYANDLNHADADICMHGIVGKNKKDIVEVYQTLPYNICCWGCGRGEKGSYNYDPTACIQFEICEDDLEDKRYFEKAMKAAVEYCAYLCKMYDIPVDYIVSHKEACAKGYASNHGDPENWLTIYGKDMNWFRSQVQKILSAQETPSTSELYYCVQVGAFKDRQNAESYLKELKAAGFSGYITTKGV